jgi:exodeoxyribonuclease VII large subunit
VTIQQQNRGRIFTVSQLTAEIKDLLEDRFPFIWITGEISNFRSPSSGHFYFVLKDADAQISAVMFRGQNQMLKFALEDGMRVTGLGRINVYEPRGTYQIVLEYLEPKGAGALQAAFEQLKAKLASEGLFDPIHKREIPFLPRRIAVVTSPTGSVVHDILHVLNRRFSTLPVLIYPVKVQGDGSDIEIASALDRINDRSDIDVIILARGGGSLEDLQAFNSETTARAIFRSEIPVISAVGHETDYTISDFVADLRAPTPSAAAELAVPRKDDLVRRHVELFWDLKSALNIRFQNMRIRIDGFSQRLIDPRRKLIDLRMKTDDYNDRIVRSMRNALHTKHNIAEWCLSRLFSTSPQRGIENNKLKLKEISNNILYIINKIISMNRSEMNRLIGKIDALNPHAVLDRGYSITQRLPDEAIVYSSDMIDPGEKIRVTLSKGSLIGRVERKK